jgi:hypothetical protein
MRKIYTLLLCVLASFITKAQAPGTITGTVNDQQNKPIHGATVSLLKANDSSVVKFTATNKAGNYEFAINKPGKYLISVTSIGFNKGYSNLFEFAVDKSVTVATLAMNASTKDLSNVTVQSKRPFIETKLDKTIVNVEASPTNAGATALEVLEKSPGVMVNNDGVISLRGKQGVIVMIDGKQTYLSATDLANLLKNMPASALDQIEIMTNPSARFDASGNSGIINIKTKKGQAGGFNGSIMIGATTSIYRVDGNTYLMPKSQNSFTFNYRKNKLNFFGNYNPNFFRGRNTMTINRNFVKDGVMTGSSDQVTRFKFGNDNHTLKLGLDWYKSKKDIFGVVASGFMFNGHPTPVTISNTRKPDGSLSSKMISSTDNDISFKNFTGNLNWKHNFDSAGKELTADFDYVRYRNVSDMTLATDFYNSANQYNGNMLLHGYIPSDINIYTFKSDYVRPYKNGKFEAGIKNSFVKNDNLVDYNRLIDDKWVADSRSNHFIYEENINAAYISANKQLKKWNVQAGLRYENTIAKGHQVTNDSTFKRNMNGLFPSAFASYAINKTNSLTLSYSRRITRPNYQDLNPFTFFLDSLTYRSGNPYLLPQYTHNVEMSYAYKSKYIATLNYNNTNDVISQILRQKKIPGKIEEITFLTAENVAKFRNIGLSITAPLALAKWWNANLFTNIYNNGYKGVYENKPIDVTYTSFMVNLTNSFTLGKGYTAEISGFYRHKGVDQLTILDPIYQMSFGAQKQIIKGKGTLRLNMRDPFGWQRFRGLNQYGDVDMRFYSRPDTRQVTATFSYRFGKNNQQAPPPRRRSSSSQDEQNRVGSGGG